jgi:hypothetical protein
MGMAGSVDNGVMKALATLSKIAKFQFFVLKLESGGKLGIMTV